MTPGRHREIRHFELMNRHHRSADYLDTRNTKEQPIVCQTDGALDKLFAAAEVGPYRPGLPGLRYNSYIADAFSIRREQEPKGSGKARHQPWRRAADLRPGSYR